MKTSSKALSVFLTAFLLSMLALASLTAQAATPAAPTLSVGNQTNGLRAQWNAVAGAEKYIVYYRQAGDAQWSSDETTGTAYTLTEAESGVLYYMQVQSVAGESKGGFSKVKSMTFISRAAITSLSYNGSNTLKWDAVAGANGYQIAELKKGDKAYTYYTVSETSFTKKNAEGGTTFTYQVRAMYQTEQNGTAYGAWSAGKTVTTLVKPTVKLANKSNGIRVQWNAIRGTARYKVYYKTADDAGWSSAETSDLYYPLLNLKAGSEYFVQVQPIGTAGVKGPYSAVQRLTYIPAVKPALTLSNKSNGIRAEWNAIAGATGYLVYYKTYTSDWYWDYTQETYYPMLDLNRGTEYYVQVQPIFDEAFGSYSAVKSLVYSPVATGKPVLRIFSEHRGIVVDWVPIEGAHSYELYYREASSSTWEKFTTSPVGVLLTGASKGTNYAFQMRAVFPGNVKGPFSKVYYHVHGEEQAPVLTGQRTDTSISLSWTPVPNATRYRVFLLSLNDPTESWTAIFTRDTEMQIDDIDPDESFECKVAPYYGETEGISSNCVSLYADSYLD